MYPLANDENGVALEVPSAAVGWLVRRHGGGKGRPAAVYDGDGRPLVVDLTATVRDLRENGCGVGPYRLEAVDTNRRTLGVVAHTEIIGDATLADQPARAAGDSVEAIAQAMLAMQRAQTEQTRQLGQLLSQCIDRLGAVPPHPTQDLRSTLNAVGDLRKTLDKIAPPAAPSVVEMVESEPEPEESTMKQVWNAVVQHGTPVFHAWVMKRLGLTPEQFAALQAAQAAVATAGTPPTPPSETAPTEAHATAEATTVTATATAPAAPTISDADRFTAIMDKLTDDEQEACATFMASATPTLIETAATAALSMTVDEAVAFIREKVLPMARAMGAKPNPGTGATPSNGAHASEGGSR